MTSLARPATALGFVSWRIGSMLETNLPNTLQANTVKLWSWRTSEFDPSLEDLSDENLKGAEPDLMATFDHSFGDVNEIKVVLVP